MINSALPLICAKVSVLSAWLAAQDAEFFENKRARKEGREPGSEAYVTPGRRKQDELDAALRDQLTFEVKPLCPWLAQQPVPSACTCTAEQSTFVRIGVSTDFSVQGHPF